MYRFIAFVLVVALSGALILQDHQLADLLSHPPVLSLVEFGFIILFTALLAFRPRHMRDDTALIEAFHAFKDTQETTLTYVRTSLQGLRSDVLNLGTRVEDASLSKTLPQLVGQLNTMPLIDSDVVETLQTLDTAIPLAKSLGISLKNIGDADLSLHREKIITLMEDVQDLGEQIGRIDLDALKAQEDTVAQALKALPSGRKSIQSLDERFAIFQKAMVQVVGPRFNDYTNYEGFIQVFRQEFRKIAPSYIWEAMPLTNEESTKFRKRIATWLNSCGSGWKNWESHDSTVQAISNLLLESNLPL